MVDDADALKSRGVVFRSKWRGRQLIFRANPPTNFAAIRLERKGVETTEVKDSEGMPPVKEVIHFAQFLVRSQTFYVSSLSAALVNLKPILPGHSLVIPRRVVVRFADLSAAEVPLLSALYAVTDCRLRIYFAGLIEEEEWKLIVVCRKLAKFWRKRINAPHSQSQFRHRPLIS